MDALIWILMPGFVAVGSGLLAYFVMQSRMDVAIAREREALAQARGSLEAERVALGESLKGAEESARRKALDDFLADIRLEQRHYVREHKVLFLHRRSLVLEERIFFRNLPLSNWIQHEILLEEGADVDKVVRTLSAFDNGVLRIDQPRALKALR
ncbi:MAG: hypothetical protein BWY94_00328 [Actinobacteria bacterium ADurb.BinA094]|nr:MAG: hypothetical protein BWY94_00328 [Actinobacteria bacterium ADurb.BinA094]